MSPKQYTTKEAAKVAKVSRPTIQYWVSTGKIKAPALLIRNGRATRLWSAAEVGRLEQLGKTLKPGPSKAGKGKKS
jgi:excisionase family DNA binding protein